MATRYADREEFCRVAELHVARDLIKLLGITERTLRAWKAGRCRIPWAAFQLAFDHCFYGLAERDAAEGFNRLCLEGLNRVLTERCRKLEYELAAQAKFIDWGCANDPFIHHTDPRARQIP